MMAMLFFPDLFYLLIGIINYNFLDVPTVMRSRGPFMLVHQRHDADKSSLLVGQSGYRLGMVWIIVFLILAGNRYLLACNR